jgi:2'-5' RNA ligase
MTAVEPNLRLFVAIELPPEWLEALEQAQGDLRAGLEKRGVRRLRWVRPEAIHLTLKFLGGVPESRVPSVEWALREATRAPFAFGLAMGRLGAFGDRRGPRVVWAGLDGVEVADRQRLYALVEHLETWFASAGFPREGRFGPHLTLARVPEDFSREERAAVAEVSAGVSLRRTEPFAATAIALMRTHLGPGGARYERLAAFPEESGDTIGGTDPASAS